jgi:endonuclease/exonuclease/phosphatase family metal-dependent hydrolase
VSERILRVATWNIHGLRAGVDAVARAIGGQEPDIVLVQESGPRRKLATVGDALGYLVCGDPRAFPRRRVENAVLVRSRSATAVRYRLVRFSGGSLLYPRGALIAEIDEDLTATSIHLGLGGAERARHIRQFLSLEPRGDGRFVFGGDLNVTPSAPGPALLAEGATDCWHAVGDGVGATFPSDAPTVRIDYLFAGPALEPLRAWTAGETISDHLMVVADLRVPERPT